MRGRGGYIGFNRVPAASATNSAASGLWTVREAESLKRAGTWPVAPPDVVGSGLQLWLDASDRQTLFDATSGGSLVAADGVVRRWEDKSGNARHVSGSSGPTRKTSAVNSRDALLFSSSLLTSSSMNFSNASAASLFAVVQFSNNGNFQLACAVGTSGAVVSLGLCAYRSGTQYSADVGNNLLASENYAFGSSVTSSTVHLSNVFSNPTVTLYRAGVSVGSATYSSNLNSAGGFCVGSYFSTSVVPLAGHMCEVILLNRAATLSEIANVQAYFSEKWGV